MASNVLTASVERVSKELPTWFSVVSTVANKIHRKATVEPVGERDFRVVYMSSPGGRPGTFDPNLGDMGRGSYQDTGVMTSTYFPLRFACEMPMIVERGTRGGRAVLNAFRDSLKRAAENFPAFIDRAFMYGDGTATLAQATAHTTSGGNSVYTMDTSKGVMGLRTGEYYILYQNDLSAARDSGASRKCIAINYDTREVTFSGTVTSAGATDKVCFEGGGGGANPTGLKGLRYNHDTATSGTTHGVNRATVPEIQPCVRQASSVPTVQMGLHIAHKVMKRRGIESGLPASAQWVVPPEQQANLRQNVLDIANFDMSNGKIDADLGKKATMNFDFAGVPAMVSIHQRSDIMDLMIFDNWAIAEVDAIRFHEDPMNGQRFFPLYGASGGTAAGFIWYLVQLRDYIGFNPGEGGVIYDCSTPVY